MNYTFKWTVVENLTATADKIAASMSRVSAVATRVGDTFRAVTPPVAAVAAGVTSVTAAVTRTEDAMDKATRATAKWTRAMGPARGSLAQLEQHAEDLDRAFNRATSVARMTRLAGALRRNATELGVMQLRARLLKGELFQLGGMGGRISSMFGGVIALAGGYGLGQLITTAVTAQAEYGKLKAVLANTFESAPDAERYLKIVDDFAQKTPFKLTEVRESMMKLVNRGILPSQAEMFKLGEIASVTGKGLGQLVEAIMDGQMIEFERFKEFGIKASAATGKVVITFKNASMEVAKNAKAIWDGLLSLADAQGVKGSMNAIMKSMAGGLSNLGDQWDFFMQATGAALEPLIQKYLPVVIEKLAEWSDWVQANGPEISGWIDEVVRRASELWNTLLTVGKWAGIALGMMLAFSVISSIVGPIVMLWRGLTFAMAAYRAGVVTATGIQAFFNAVMMANPVGLITLGIMAAVAAIIYLYTQFDSFGEFLMAWGQALFDYSPFGWLLKVIDYYFPEVTARAKELFQTFMDWGLKLWNWLDDNLFGPLGRGFADIVEWAKRVGIIDVGVNVDKIGVGILARKTTTEPVEDKESFMARLAIKVMGGLDTSSGNSEGDLDTGAGGKITKQSGELTSSRAGKHVVINIDKLVERMEFHTSSLRESTSKIREEVSRVLLDAVNDSNYAI